MTALSTEWAPGASPGARPFENMPADLELAGVQYTLEQLEFGSRAAVFRPGPWWNKLHGMAVYCLPDPVFPQSAALGIPAMSLDEDLTPAPVVIPTVVEVDCSEWETMDEQEPHWRRFPSVLGRRHVYSAHTGLLVDGLEAFRLWDIVPIDEHDAELLQHALKEWFDKEWAPYLGWLEVRDNEDVRACDVYESLMGLPDGKHKHDYDDDGYLRVCRDGEAWYEHFGETRIYSDPLGDPYPRPFAPVAGLHHLAEPWEHLAASARSNAKAAINSYPEWEQEQVVLTERHYTPWLWS